MKRLFFLSVAAVLLISCGCAFAISADDFLPPIQEENPAKRAELLAVKDENSITASHDNALDADLTVAPSLQDAINKIIAKPKTGCQFAKVSDMDGVTLVATGMGTYSLNYANAQASRIEQRNAYIQAFMRAKSELARTLSGISITGASYFEHGSQSATDSSKTLNNTGSITAENQSQWTRAVLKGYVTYSVLDDGKGRVYVTIVSSPKTRGYTRNGADGLTAPNLRDGINAVIAEIRSGLVPPVGGRIIEVSGTNEIAWVGFGSSIVRHDPEPDVQAELELRAEEIAGLRAVDGLAGIVLGDDTKWQAHADEYTTRQIKSFENLQSDDPTTKSTEKELKEYQTRIKEFRNTLSYSEKVTSLRNGILPPGIVRQTDLDEDKYFAYGIAVYIPSVSETVTKNLDPHDDENASTDTTSDLDTKRGPSGVVEQPL